MLHLTNHCDNSIAEFITFHALRLSVKSLVIDYETCYTLLKGTVKSYIQPFTFAIHRTIATGSQVVGMLP